jgi:hypothetical protein
MISQRLVPDLGPTLPAVEGWLALFGICGDPFFGILTLEKQLL